MRRLIIAVLVLIACKRGGARAVADDARAVTPLNPDAPVVSSWPELAQVLERCFRGGQAERDTRVRVSVVRGRAIVGEEACWGDAAEPACVRETIEAASYVGALRDITRTLSITRRIDQSGLVQFGPVRVRTFDDVKKAIAAKGYYNDVEILWASCKVEW